MGNLSAAGLLAMACASAPAGNDVPAVALSWSPEAHAELTKAVSDALGAPVTLANDVLTRDGALVVERTARRGPDGTRAQGRETGRPDHFRLVRSGERCVLVHEESARRFVLSAAACRPKPTT